MNAVDSLGETDVFTFLAANCVDEHGFDDGEDINLKENNNFEI